MLHGKNAKMVRAIVNATYMGLHVAKNDLSARFVSRTALHDACSSGCSLCVEPLLQAKADGNAAMNVTVFPKDWDILTHPWMWRHLGSNTGEPCENYNAMWHIQPLHFAILHHCIGCLSALLAGKVQLESAMNLGNETTCIRKALCPQPDEWN